MRNRKTLSKAESQFERHENSGHLLLRILNQNESISRLDDSMSRLYHLTLDRHDSQYDTPMSDGLLFDVKR